MQRATSLDETFDERADRFGRTFERLTTPTSAFGFRITAMPKGSSLDIDAVMERAPHLIEGLEKQDITITRHYDDRSARVVGLEDIHRLHCNGLVEFGWASNLEYDDLDGQARAYDLYTDYVTIELANVMGWVDALRELAQVGWAPYEVDVAVFTAASTQLRVLHGGGPSYGASQLLRHQLSGTLSEPMTRLPRCSFTELTADTLSAVERDLCHAANIGNFSGSLQLETVAP